MELVITDFPKLIDKKMYDKEVTFGCPKAAEWECGINYRSAW